MGRRSALPAPLEIREQVSSRKQKQHSSRLEGGWPYYITPHSRTACRSLLITIAPQAPADSTSARQWYVCGSRSLDFGVEKVLEEAVHKSIETLRAE